MSRLFLFLLVSTVAAGCVSDPPGSGSNTPEDSGVTTDAGTDAAPDEGEDAGTCDCADVANGTATCTETGECDYSCDDGFTACDPEKPNVCTAFETANTSCGACPAVDCTTQTAPSVIEAVCSTVGEPECVVAECAPGSVDENGELADGCECPESETPVLATDAIPTECDRITDQIVFVRSGATGSGKSPDDPTGSLQAAILLAQTMNRDSIFVAQTLGEDFLSENIDIDANNGGVSIFGGRNPSDEWAPFEGPTSIVVGADSDLPAARIRNAVTGRVVRLHGIRFEQREETNAGNASITVEVSNTSEEGLLLSQISISGGPAADGLPGDQAIPGISGGDGDPGVSPLAGEISAAGGTGGSSPCSPGGNGGNTQIPTCSFGSPTPERAFSGGGGTAGGTGSTPAGGEGGANRCGTILDPTAGLKGEDGNWGNLPNAISGDPTSDLTGSFVDGSWTPSRGGDGLPGVNGAGGAGGGGGGSVLATNELGGSGAGGGGGGCGGGAGLGGRSGGDSIALLLINSTLDLSGVAISYGEAGDGGPGGDGACGGAFGEGGLGGIGSANGGPGGNGTSGASGGGGAGGNGGAAIAIGFVGTSSTSGNPTIDELTGRAGMGSVGGFDGTFPDRTSSIAGIPATCGAPDPANPDARAPAGNNGVKVPEHTF